MRNERIVVPRHFFVGLAENESPLPWIEMIRDEKTYQIFSAMQIGKSIGTS